MPSAPANHDPALPHPLPGNSLSSAPQGPPSNIGDVPGEVAASQLSLDSNQMMAILRHLPGVLNKFSEQGTLKEDAAQTLSNLSQATFPAQHPLPYPGVPHTQHQAISDPGPSSHPRGPPNLGQLSAVAAAGVGPMSQMPASRSQEMEEGTSDNEEGGNLGGPAGNTTGPPATSPSATGGRTRGNRGATMGSDEWSRQRKDNHKEVERRRRGNINEGINELGRIVPNGSGEKAKGAILSRAVQYIHHLKENEARNIEKWTLEKLLMDQAMGDLQAQLEEVKRLWEEERIARQRAESELEVLRGIHTTRPNGGFGSRSRSPEDGGVKRRSGDGEADGAEDKGRDDGEGRSGKRQRRDERRDA